MIVRNYDRQYVRFRYQGVYTKAVDANTSFTILPSNYINATAELMCRDIIAVIPSFLSISPTVGLVWKQLKEHTSIGSYSTEETFICPLSASITLNTSLLKRKDTNGQAIKTDTAVSVQPSQVRYKFYEIGSESLWFGSINFVQDQLGVFVILSVGTKKDGSVYASILRDTINTVKPPISLITRLEVYHFYNNDVKYVIGQSGHFTLYLYKDANDGLRLSIDTDDGGVYYEKMSFCIRGFIPGAYLHTEDL